MADFSQAPAEEQGHLRAKGQRETWSWKDFQFDEHAASFTVAKTAGYDVLGDIRKAAQDAIDNRVSFDEFRAKLTPVLQAKGWWGKKQGVDPTTGEITDVQLGSPRRLKTIYWANIRAARAASEWERAQHTKIGLPFFEYLHTTAAHPREQHLAWVGIILPVDDQWWDAHFPPSAWLCECRVLQISRSEARRKGYDPDRRPAYEGQTKIWRNDRTGETRSIPVGVDPGWDNNPGKYRFDNLRRLWDDKLSGATPEQKRIAAEDMTRQPIFETIAKGKAPYDNSPANNDPLNRERGQFAIPVAALPEAVAKAMETDAGIVKLSVSNGVKQADRHPDLTMADYRRVQLALDAASAKWLWEPAKRQLHIAADLVDYSVKVLLRRTATAREVFLQSFHIIDKGKALEKLRQKEKSLLGNNEAAIWKKGE